MFLNLSQYEANILLLVLSESVTDRATSEALLERITDQLPRGW